MKPLQNLELWVSNSETIEKGKLLKKIQELAALDTGNNLNISINTTVTEKNYPYCISIQDFYYKTNTTR